ncbi:MAG TPA: SpoIIE family protein phosphatase [Bacillota bacterium]|nr:SpoIIE family protein phosphatase [Bacillota bacterium]
MEIRSIEVKPDLSVSQLILEQSSDGVIITNDRAEICYINPTFTRMTGYRLEEVMGENPRILQSGIHDTQFYIEMWKEVKSNGKWEGEIWNKRKSGEIYLEWLSFRSIRDQDGKTIYYIAIFRDITEQDRVRRDVFLTGQLQRKMLPANFRNHQVAIQTLYTPARYVSGDFFDYRWNVDRTILSGYLFDVMGNGLATALQSISLRVLFEQMISNGLPIHAKLNWINQQAFQLFSEDTFAAAIFFAFDFKKKILSYSSAGIPYFLYQQNGQIQKMKVAGLFLGLLENAQFDCEQISFDSGDSFFFMSDGLFEVLPPPSELSFDRILNNTENLVQQNKHVDDRSGLCVQIN